MHIKKLKPSETKELRFKFEFKFEFKSNFKHMNFNLSHTEDHSEYEPIQWNSAIITLIHLEDCKDVDREQHEQPNFWKESKYSVPETTHIKISISYDPILTHNFLAKALQLRTYATYIRLSVSHCQNHRGIRLEKRLRKYE